MIRFTFLHTGETAIAMLRENDAPETCRAITAALPVASVCHHASYSGSEGVVILPELVCVSPENATAEVRPGDVGYTWFAAGSAYGVVQAFSEICWFYDQDARPSMHEGPAPVSLFARFTGDTEAFFRRSRAMRRSGVTGLLAESASDERDAAVVPYYDPANEAPITAHDVVTGDGAVRLAPDAATGGCRLLRRRYPNGSWFLSGEVVAGGWTIGSADLALVEDGLAAILSVGGTNELVVSFSHDGGATWSAARPTGLRGTKPSLLALGNGVVALAYDDESGLSFACGSSLTDLRPIHPFANTTIDGLAHPILLPLGPNRICCAAHAVGARTPDTLLIIPLPTDRAG